MNSVNMKQGIILNTRNNSLRGRKENYTHERKFNKEGKKVIEKELGELKQRSSLAELTRIGARMMLEVAVEDELIAFLGMDYYERRTDQEGSRSGSKPRTIKIGSGDIEINMPKVRDAGGPFHSKILPPRVTRMDEVQDVIPLLYMNGLSSRKVKKSVARLVKNLVSGHRI